MSGTSADFDLRMLGDLVIGVIGVLLGGFLFETLGISGANGLVGSIIVASVGAIVLLVLIRLFKRA